MVTHPVLIAAVALSILAASPALAGDAAKGAGLFKAKCGACHAAEATKEYGRAHRAPWGAQYR